MSEKTTLVWVERDGTVRPLSSPPLIYGDMALSPDGARLAIQTKLPESIGLYDLTLDRSPLTRLTHDKTDTQWTPSWSKDGRYVMFFSGEGRVSMSRAWPGSEQREEMWSSGQHAKSADISPDGKWCVFNRVAPGKGWDIWLLELGGQKTARALLDSADWEVSPKISYDGRWMAYASSEDGRFDVWVRDFPSMTGKVQVSIEGGVQPRWSRTSSELFFQNGHKMMVAQYRADKAGFVVTTRSELFNKRFHWKEAEGYDVSQGGRRLLMLQSMDPGATYLNMVYNWADSLRNPR
jgi:serine/threonine-protein kinase